MIRKIFSLFFFVIIGFILSSCSDKTNHVKKKEILYPSWFLNYNTSDNNYLYGIGEGINFSEARTKALSDLSSNLFVNISSSFETKSASNMDYREYISKSSNLDMKSEIEDLDFSNYKVEKSKQLTPNSFIVLVKVSKYSLIKNLDLKKNLLFNNLVKLVNNNTLDKFLKLKKFKNLKHDFEEYKNKFIILSSIDNSFDLKDYTNSVILLEDRINKLKENLSFNLILDRDSRVYESTIKNKISKLQLSLNGTNVSYTHNIFIKSNLTRKKSYGFFIIENQLNIGILNKNNQVVHNKTINLKGVSTKNYEDAMFDSLDDLIKINFD